MVDVTRTHRLAVARAWEGDEPQSDHVKSWLNGEPVVPSLTDTTEMLERMAQLVADAEGAWIPVAEKAPPTGICVLVDGGCAYFDGIDWRTLMGADAHRKIEWTVTHWRPLPKGPEQP